MRRTSRSRSSPRSASETSSRPLNWPASSWASRHHGRDRGVWPPRLVATAFVRPVRRRRAAATWALARRRGGPDPGQAEYVERGDHWCGSCHRESLRAMEWEFAERVGQHDQRDHTPSGRPARQRGWRGLSSVDQSRNPEGYGQKQQYPSGEDGDAEGDDRHLRFCYGERHRVQRRHIHAGGEEDDHHSPPGFTQEPHHAVRPASQPCPKLAGGLPGPIAYPPHPFETGAPTQSEDRADLADAYSDGTADRRRGLLGEPSHLRRCDVDLAVEDRDQRGQHAVCDRDDELQEQLPTHTVTRITDSSIRALACGRARSIGLTGRLDSTSAPWTGRRAPSRVAGRTRSRRPTVRGAGSVARWRSYARSTHR